MIRLLTDQHISLALISAVRSRVEAADIVRVEEVGLRNAPDQEILAWAAREGRVVLTFDRKTIPGLAYDRVLAGLTMPGVLVADDERYSSIANDLEIVLKCSHDDDCRDQVVFLPLR